MANKSKNKSNKNTQRFYEKYSPRHCLVNYFLFVMFTIFPLFFTNYFFNIRHDKYYFFLTFSVILLIVEGVFIYSAYQKKPKSAEIAPTAWYKKLSLTDWAMLALLVSCVISTVFSENPADAFLGTMGRNNGLLLIICYVVVYFIISRYFYFMEYVMVALAITSMIVSLLAVLNCFYIDPIGMFDRISDEKTINNFISTIGNKNLLSSYLCIVVPVTITLAVHTKKKAFRIIYLASSGLGFAGMMTADSYSGILGLIGFGVIFFIWYSRRIDRLKVFFLSFTIMFASAKLLRLFSLCMGDVSKGMSDFQSLFVYNNSTYIILVAFAAITALLYLLDYKKPGVVLPKAVPIVFSAITLLGLIGIGSIVVYFSTVDTTTDLGSLGSFLRFNDRWGTHRGFMWIRSFEIFADYSIFNKLFGCGPDTFYAVFSPYFNELLKFGDSSTNAAHNEYLNYLITIGITGLASYVAIVVGAIRSAVKTASKNPLAIVCASAVICYSIQAVVNIATPITTPLFIIFIALCEGTKHLTQQEDENSFIYVRH